MPISVSSFCLKDELISKHASSPPHLLLYPPSYPLYLPKHPRSKHWQTKRAHQKRHDQQDHAAAYHLLNKDHPQSQKSKKYPGESKYPRRHPEHRRQKPYQNRQHCYYGCTQYFNQEPHDNTSVSFSRFYRQTSSSARLSRGICSLSKPGQSRQYGSDSVPVLFLHTLQILKIHIVHSPGRVDTFGNLVDVCTVSAQE